MNRHSPAQAPDGALFFGRDELAEGLTLFRAGTLKMIRLQLAMEQRDRRVALEAVDDLVALDRQLQDYLAQLPAPAAPSALLGECENERVALNREKLALGAGVVRREAKAPALEPEAQAPTWGTRDFAVEEERRRRRGLRWLAGSLMLVAALAGATFVTGVSQGLRALVVQTQ
jgi:hypothetical protein